MEQDTVQPEPYRYQGQPLMPAGIQELILELFSGETVERQVIVESVRNAHISRGGAEPRTADFPRSVKKALANLKLAGIATNPSFGFWQIKSRDGVVIQLLPISNETDDPEDESLDLEPDADVVLGTGTSAVYVYYYNTYREYALQSNLDRWACKVGRTDRCPLNRVLSQAATALPEYPHIAIILRTSKLSPWESVIHDILTIRGHAKNDAPGSEWFITSPSEILDIIRIIQPELLSESTI